MDTADAAAPADGAAAGAPVPGARPSTAQRKVVRMKTLKNKLNKYVHEVGMDAVHHTAKVVKVGYVFARAFAAPSFRETHAPARPASQVQGERGVEDRLGELQLRD